jgi:hypothetical protein
MANDDVVTAIASAAVHFIGKQFDNEKLSKMISN